MGEFREKVILVTGGGSGIGKATALLFAREQANVVIMDWNETAGQETLRQIHEEGGEGMFLKADIGKATDVQQSVCKAARQYGNIDILFANAAVQINKPLEETTEDDWNRMLSTNLTGTFLCCKEVASYMRSQGGGCIVICSSGHAFNTYPGYAGYATTKGGLLSFMRSAALDLAPSGIRVNCIIPGATETPLLRYHFQNNPEDERRLLDKIPMGRLATPEDIARGVRLLASSDASYITGAWLAVDGGLLAHG
jgi:NAD(P)-dependent dehydrogenase (short-subunit alcohol dehydrogenase family)